MSNDDVSPWPHEHRTQAGNPQGERNTWRVVGLTAVMMVVEIAGGRLFQSMALLADGWHMGTHVAALGITALAYWLARRYAEDESFAFGTYKIEVLGGFSSALVLGMVALEMTVESIERLWTPSAVHYDEALVVTVVGLAVNVACALMLTAGGHEHDHGDSHAHDDGHDHGSCAADKGPSHKHDMNLRAAYVHILADAFTSILAIVALVGGKYFGWIRLDPIMGIVGAAVITVWAIGLVREAGRALLDKEMDHPLVDDIRRTLEADGETKIADLHIWRVGKRQFYGAVAVASSRPRTAAAYREMLAVHPQLVHVTIEVVQA